MRQSLARLAAVVHVRYLHALLETVLGADDPDRPGARAHDHRLAGSALRRVTDTLEQDSVGHAGRSKEGFFSAAKILRRQDSREVVAGVDGSVPLLVVPRPQPSLDLAADALQRCGRNDAFGRTADPIQKVDTGSFLRGGDRAGDVAVADQAHARAHLP